MLIEEDVKLNFDNVLIRPKRSTLRSRAEVDLNRTYIFKHSKLKWTGIPIIASNMNSVGTFEMYEALKNFGLLTAIHKHYTYDEWTPFVEAAPDKNRFVVSIGAKFEDLEEMPTLDINFLCIDVANGYGEYLVEFIEKAREVFPNVTIIAGNVVTAEMTEQLILSGADVVKVGLGSGSFCTTRLVTGVGYPQLSAIIECADAAHGLGAYIISDGGCNTSGDIAKAFGAGADFVMLGGMLAGHDEGGGETIRGDDGIDYKVFYGMSSKTANEKYNGGLKEYKSAEGREGYVKYKGPVKETIQQILGGLRSTCTYVGAPTLKQLSKCTTFIKVTK